MTHEKLPHLAPPEGNKPPFNEYLVEHPDFASWIADHATPVDAPAQVAPKPVPTMRAMDISQMQSYYNSRPQDWNRCGQAAIAAMLDFCDKPLGPLESPPWDDGAAIDQIVDDGFGPDVVFGLGTSGGRIRDALTHYGLTNAFCGFSGVGDIGWEDCWTSVQNSVHAGHPVPCCVDTGTLGGPWYQAHWLIVYAIDGTAIRVANWSASSIEQQTFLAAWACHFLPYGYNHCYVTAW